MVELKLAKDLTFEDKPLRILEEMDRVTRSKTIKFYKVQWEHHTEDEATWEREDFLRTAYPYLFPEQPNLEDEIHPKGGRFVTPWILPFFFYWDLLNILNWHLGFQSILLDLPLGIIFDFLPSGFYHPYTLPRPHPSHHSAIGYLILQLGFSVSFFGRVTWNYFLAFLQVKPIILKPSHNLITRTRLPCHNFLLWFNIHFLPENEYFHLLR
jgi:hypothetical protein